MPTSHEPIRTNSSQFATPAALTSIRTSSPVGWGGEGEFELLDLASQGPNAYRAHDLGMVARGT